MTAEVRDAAPRMLPELSVVVVVGNLRERVGPCLRSILDQDVEDVEILLVDIAGDGAASITPPHADHERVRRLRLEPGISFAAARRRGVEEARAPLVAFLEEHCRARAGWARTLLATFAEPQEWAGVAYGFENANPGVGISDFSMATSYGSFLAADRRREARMLSGHNVAYRRDVLLDLGERLETLLHVDLVLHEVLVRAGHRLLFEPAALVAHLNETTLRSRARGLFLFHRVYGWRRADEFGWSVLRRLVWAVGFPLVPLWGVALALARRVSGSGGSTADGTARLMRSPRLLFACFWAAGLGQAVGLLAGAGGAIEAFTRFEHEEPRPEA